MTLLGFMGLSGMHFISGAWERVFLSIQLKVDAALPKYESETNDNKEKLQNTLAVCLFVCLLFFIFWPFTFRTLKGSSSNKRVCCLCGLCYKVNTSDPHWMNNLKCIEQTGHAWVTKAELCYRVSQSSQWRIYFCRVLDQRVSSAHLRDLMLAEFISL